MNVLSAGCEFMVATTQETTDPDWHPEPFHPGREIRNCNPVERPVEAGAEVNIPDYVKTD